MLKEKDEKEVEEMKYVFKANKIPRTTSEPLYDKKVQEAEERR